MARGAAPAPTFCNRAIAIAAAEPCPICAVRRSQLVLLHMERALHRCDACGFLFVSPRPSGADLSRAYTEEYWTAANEHSAAFRGPVFDECLDMLDRFRPCRGRLLDVGCGSGGFMEAAVRRGWQASGIELSARAAEMARNKRLDVRCSTLISAPYDSSSFDAITVLDVLEHVAEPLQDLERARDLLAPSGLLAVRVPNTVFHMARTRACAALRVTDFGLQMNYHLNHFTPDTLLKSLRRCGLRTLALEVGAPETIAHAPWAAPWAKLAYVQFARCIKAVTGAHLENVMVAYAEKGN